MSLLNKIVFKEISMQNIQDILDLQKIISEDLRSEVFSMKLDSVCRVEPIADYVIRKILNKYSIKLAKYGKQLFVGFDESQALGGNAEVYGYNIELPNNEKAILFFHFDYQVDDKEYQMKIFNFSLKEVKTLKEIEEEAANILSRENKLLSLSRLCYFDKYK